MRFRLVVTSLAMLVFVACSATAQFDVDQAEAPAAIAEPVQPDAAGAEVAPSPPRPTPTAPPAPERSGESAGDSLPSLGPPASDRIVVATQDGQVYLIDPDGQQRLDLSVAGGVGLQPVWSPDGRRIAWSQRDQSGFSITSTNADGSELRRANTLFSGYFGYWNPTSNLLGFLGNAPPGTGLVLDSGTGADLNAVVDSDTFYYFSWSPDGTRWFVHSGSGFSIVTLDGTSTRVDLDDARFRAPIWADDGSVLLALRSEGRTVIAELNPDTSEFEELLEVGDVTNFVLDPTGRYLAVESLVFGENEDDAGEGITVSASFQPREPGAEVLIYDRQTGNVRQAFDGPTGGFWWSPDGTTLAILVQEEGPAPEFVQWLVWQADATFRTERFRITPAFASTYVPFFDQFALSVTPWSPDSRRFVYGAFDQTGDPGVYVQPAQPDTAAQRISEDAGIAFWSPT